MKKAAFWIFALSLIFVNTQMVLAFHPVREEVLVFEGTVLTLKPLAPPATAEAIEDTPDFSKLKQFVRFQVTRIIKGTIKEGGKPSSDGLVKKLFAPSEKPREFDSYAGQKDLEDLRFKIAVTDSVRTLNLTPEEIGFARYRLYFKRYKNEETTFILSRFEKLSPAKIRQI